MEDKEKQFKERVDCGIAYCEDTPNKYIDRSWKAKMVEKGIYKDSETTSEEKQIEEMAKLIDDRIIDARGYLGSMNKGTGYWIAQKLIEHYQPKLSEDCVVISREEYESLKNEPASIFKDYQEMAKFYDEEAQKNEELIAENIELNEEIDIFNHLCNKWVKINNKHIIETQRLEAENEKLKNQLENKVKETAEKIIKWFKENSICIPKDEYINEFVKQFGIEIKE